MIQTFDTYAELQEHDRDSHNYCTDCQRSFQSESNLRHHLNSRVHRPANVRCPGRDCNRTFVSYAALVLHFESGTCPSRMTREQLNRFVVRVDTNNYITNPARLLTGPLGRSEPPASTVTWATGRSWNGYAYQCFLCNRTFDTLPRLNQHLQSPVHQDKIYRCPKSDCRIEFVALSGLCQHVEGGSCGVRMFRQVRDVMDSLTMGFNTLTM
jgi:Zinc-finger double-stranded RNA-binding/Zinc-finger of C2H2 type